MKNILSLLLITILTLSMLSSCASKKNSTTTPKGYTNTRTINTTNSSTVVCHNCRAKFKLSYRIQKLVKAGQAEVRCPECHRNYITGQVVR